MTDTWGIPGPAFLAIFLVLATILFAGTLARRRHLLRGRRDARLDRFDPQGVAYLNGGGWLASYASLGGLRGAGVVGAGPGRTLAASAPLPAGTSALDAAVYDAAGRGVRARQLARDPRVGGALDQLRADLERDGLALTEEARRGARWATLPLIVLAGVGFARIAVGVDAGRPVGFLVAIEMTVVLTLMVLLVRVPRASTAGRRALDDLRRRNAHLAPKHRPSLSTYGAAGAGMGVALFGVGALWAMDPSFAAAAEIERGGAAGAAYSGDGGGGGGGGGGGCGG